MLKNKQMYCGNLQIAFLLFLTLFIIPKKVNAQCELISSTPKLSGELYQQKIIYAGNPYFLDNWVKGDVTLESGGVVKDQLLKYNALEDQLIWKEPNSGRVVSLDRFLISSFTLTISNYPDSIIYFERLPGFSKRVINPSNDFFQLLYNGRVSLYAKRWVEVTSKIETVFIGGKGQNSFALVHKTNYYVYVNNSRLISIGKSRRSLIKALLIEFPNIDKKEFHKRINRIRSEEDLIHAIIVIESLIS